MDGDPAHGAAGHGGFIQFPSGSFTPDPASLGSFDRAFSKWLPVPRAWISPDGKRYAYSVNPPGNGPQTGTIHLVDVATGSDRPFLVPSTSNVVSFEAEGVYIAHVVPNSGAPPTGLTLVDANTGSYRQIAAAGTWSAIVGGSAWGADLDSSIAPPANAGPGAANRIRKLDLKAGVVTAQLPSPGVNVQVLGPDAGQAVIAYGQSVNGPAYSIGRTDGVKMFTAESVSTSNPAAPIVSDNGAIWFSSQSSALWLWDSPQTGVREVATGPPQGAVVAGTCR